MFRLLTAGLVSVLLLSPEAIADAQGARPPVKGADRADSIPAAFMPPPGMCRVWLDAVPPTQQPAPTDCSLAIRNKPPNGRIVYGPVKRGTSEKRMELPVKRYDGKGAPKVRGPIKPPDRPAFEIGEREPWEARRITDAQLFGEGPALPPASSYPGGGFPVGSGGGSALDGFIAPGGQALIGTGPITDPRFFSGAPPPGRGSANCLDRDGDGWCDDFRFGPPPCLDQDRDGRCDDLPAFASLPYPQVLPQMQSALDVVQGRPSVEVARWLGTNEFVARLPDRGRGGTPWRAIFLDANTNSLLQVWTDRDRDGLVDRIEVFRDGQRVKLIQR